MALERSPDRAQAPDGDDPEWVGPVEHDVSVSIGTAFKIGFDGAFGAAAAGVVLAALWFVVIMGVAGALTHR